MTSLLDKYDTL